MSLVEAILAAILLFAPWLEGGATPEALAIIHTGVILLAGAVLWRSRKEGTLRLRLTWPALAWGLFVIWGAVSMAGAGYLYGSFESWWDQAVALLLMAALSASRPTGAFRARLPLMITALGVAQAVPALVTRLTEGASFSASFLNPNHLAAYLNLSALVALQRGGWLGGEKGSGATGRARLLHGLAAAVCLAGTVAVGSRGALLAIVAALALLTLRARIPRPAVSRRLVVVLLVVASAGTLSVWHRFEARFDPYRYDRPRLWLVALRTWAEHPLMGQGPGMYEHRAPAHAFPQEHAVFRYSKQPRSAHSLPLQVLAEEGPPGLGLLLLFAGTAAAGLAEIARRGGAAAGWSRATLLGGAVVAAHSLVEMPFGPPAIPLTLVAMGWVALDPRREDEAAAALILRWPDRREGWMPRLAVGASSASALFALLAIGVAGPYLSFAAARFAESPGRPPVRIDLAARLSEDLNPWQPFLGYRRARAALDRSAVISPPLLANAMESLDRTIRLEPGDASARDLLAELYARAAQDLPGAGPGAVAAAARLHDEAIVLAPLDARLWVSRSSFRIAAGVPEGGLADAEEAIRLEPESLTAHHLRLEALVALGRLEEAREALAELDTLRRGLEGYAPLNGYEASLLRLDEGRVEAVRKRLRSVVGPLS